MANVAGQSVEAAGEGLHRASGVDALAPVNVDGLDGGADGELDGALETPTAAIPFRACADLAAIKAIRGREAVEHADAIAREERQGRRHVWDVLEDQNVLRDVQAFREVQVA